MSLALAALLAAGLAAGTAGTASTAGDPYADAIAPGTAAMVVDGGNLLGAPDGLLATVNGRLGARIVLDLGVGEEGVGNLDVFFVGHTLADQTQVDFLDAGGGVVATGTLTMIGLGSHVATVSSTSRTPYRFVSIRAGQGQFFRFDAIRTAALASA